MKAITIGQLGLGTVGTGVLQVLNENALEIERRVGRALAVTRVAVRDLEKARICLPNAIELTTDAQAIVKADDIDVVVELIGGTELAFDLVMSAISHGKHVITANKALIAEHGNDIFTAAKAQGVTVAFEAAVAGGIPIMKVLREGLTGNCIECIAGIVNGTSNYILSKMASDKSNFAAALKSAQDKGYAEADPSFDVEGTDAAHKLAIMAAMAYGMPMCFNQVYCEGITDITNQDLHYAHELGYEIKHIAIATREDCYVRLRVHPALIAKDHILAHVQEVMNAVYVRANALGPSLFYGAGAGGEATASAVIADIIDVARETRAPNAAFQMNAINDYEIASLEGLQTAYYLRLNALDQPGVLAEVTKVLGDHKIGIEVILQKDRVVGEQSVPVVILTQQTTEREAQGAIAALQVLNAIQDKIMMIRVVKLL